MALMPELSSFEAAHGRGENQIIFARLAADLDTPVSLMLKLTGAARDAFMLESVTGGEVRGRYSIIGMKPDLIWTCRGNESGVNRQARFDSEHYEPQTGAPLDVLRALIEESQIDLPEDLPQAAAGFFGYLGYDMIRLVEHLPNINPDPLGLPDAVMMRPSVIVVLDGVKSEVTVVSPAWISDGQSARAAYAQAAERVMDAVRDLERAIPQVTRNLGEAVEISLPVSNFAKDDYLAAVEKAK
ncbi:MAG: anthranilate synthase component I, partial [Paracoccaceae bacterium]|nr:anthranilate synthase component I [Paracoccaceae bacterium]